MGECHICTQHPALLKMAILYHRNPSLSTDSSHRLPAGNHSSACLFFRIAAAITSFTLSCLMAAGYFLTISASAALAARSSSLSSTNRAERSSQARIPCHYFNLMALPTSGVLFIGGDGEILNLLAPLGASCPGGFSNRPFPRLAETSSGSPSEPIKKTPTSGVFFIGGAVET